MNDSFVVLRAYYEDAKELPDELRGDFCEAILAYGIEGTEPDFAERDPVTAALLKIIFKNVKRMIDSGNERRTQMRENGGRGGRPKAENQDETKAKPNENQTETKNNQDETKAKPNENQIKNKKQEIKNIETDKQETEKQEIEKLINIQNILTPSTRKISLNQALKENNNSA